MFLKRTRNDLSRRTAQVGAAQWVALVLMAVLVGAGVFHARDLWMEKEINSVANITRSDVESFLQMAADIPIRPDVQEYPLADANIALLELKERKIRGAKVLTIG